MRNISHIGHFDIVPAEPWTFDFITDSHIYFRSRHCRGAYACQPTITHSPHKQVWQLQKIKLFESIFLDFIIFRPYSRFYFIFIIQSLNILNNPVYLTTKNRKKENRRGFFFLFYKISLKGSTRGSLNVRWRNFCLQISPDIKYTETNIGQSVECAHDV